MCGSCGTGSCSSSCGGRCGGCKALAAIVALLTTVTTVATLIGVYMTHMTPEGAWVFGSLNGSVAILAFLASIMSWLKLVKKMCSCRKKSDCCGSGNCGGKCPGCGTDPCSCK